MVEFINTYGPMLLQVLLYALLGGVGLALKKILTRYLDTETERKLARMSVGFVEQVYKELHGPEKFNKALNIALTALQHRKIVFDENEVRQMIEAAVNEMNRQASPAISVEGVTVEDLLADRTDQDPLEGIAATKPE